jgi:hypothetical protein
VTRHSLDQFKKKDRIDLDYFILNGFGQHQLAGGGFSIAALKKRRSVSSVWHRVRTRGNE